MRSDGKMDKATEQAFAEIEAAMPYTDLDSRLEILSRLNRVRRAYEDHIPSRDGLMDTGTCGGCGGYGPLGVVHIRHSEECGTYA